MQEAAKKKTMNNFKLARLHAALTRVELARLLGVSSETIVRYENGMGKPSTPRLELMARALNVPTEFLCPEREDTTEKISAAFQEALARVKGDQR